MRVIEAPSLSALTTLGLGGTCAREIVLESEEDLANLKERIGSDRPFALGLGSNILGLDGHHDVVLVRPAFKDMPEIVAESGDAVQVRAGAGLPLPGLLRFCRMNGLSGLEGLAGIPGSVGGACAMNAGSFGTTFGDWLESCTIWCDGVVRTFARENIDLGYRHFVPEGLEKSFFLILSATLCLKKDDSTAIGERMAKNLALKKERQPVQARSAGCVFKNPAGNLSAGMLLDKAGFKGRRLGGVAMSGQHANFLINTGSGTASEAVRLLEMARTAVAGQFGVELQLEVCTVPEGGLVL